MYSRIYNICNGWIAPDGTIHYCEHMGHKDLAFEIAEAQEYYVDYNTNAYDELWKHGYIRFSGNPNCPECTIEFDEPHYNSDGSKAELTEAQKMAQARINKRLYYEKKKT